MAEMTPHVILHLTLTDKEFNVLLKGLALLIGVPGVRPAKKGEFDIAVKINKEMLESQANVYREKLRIAEGKLDKLTEDMTLVPVPEPEIA